MSADVHATTRIPRVRVSAVLSLFASLWLKLRFDFLSALTK
jgi:hypothetical protein